MEEAARFPRIKDIVEYRRSEGADKLFVVEGLRKRTYSSSPREISFGVALTLRELGPDGMYDPNGAVLVAKVGNDETSLFHVVGRIVEITIPK